MDKYEYNIKAEQIVKLIGKKDFSTAAKIADGIDWKRVRNINMLMNVGSVYAETGRYSDAKEILLMAFERAPIGRRLAYKLAEVCILSGEYEEAQHYYQNFVDLAPRDVGRYELQYKMAKKKGEPVENLISILQEYKKHDFDDAWAYELARLYHKAGMREACIAECDELILWFGEGEYVEKAMELKMLYMPLSPSQQEKYNKRFQPQMKYDEAQLRAAASEQTDLNEQLPKQPVSVSMDMYNTANIQAALAESMKELMKEEVAETEEQPEAFAVHIQEQPEETVQEGQSEEQLSGGQYEVEELLEQQEVPEQEMQEHLTSQQADQSGADGLQMSASQTADMLGATKDLRNVHKALEWNNMKHPGLREEDALSLNEQIEGQMTIDEVLAIYNQKIKESVEASKGSLFHIVAKDEKPEDVLPEELLGDFSPIEPVEPEEKADSAENEAVEQKTEYKAEEPEEEPESWEEREEAEEIPRTGIKAELDKMMKEMEIPEEKKVADGKLSEERKQIFATFLHINGMEAQLAEIFDEAERIGEEKDTSMSGNVLIIGEHKSGRTTLATEMMKSLNKATNRKGRKIAKISGDRLNNKGIKETIAHLIGADLLVERAGEMNHATVQELLHAMAGHTGGMLVVLEDTREGMEKLIAENPEVETRFTHKIILKEYEISEWVELAKQYAQELDYGIDEMGILALSAKIDSLYAQKSVVDLEDVKDIVDAAIEHSERKNIKKLFETVFSRKYKESDLTMLRENDFL